MTDEDMADELSLKCINSNPFPSSDYVNNLVHHDLSLWAEYSEKTIFVLRLFLKTLKIKNCKIIR